VVVDTEVDVRYAMSGDARLAFRVRAGGPHVIVRVPAWISNQDLANLESQVHGLLDERLSSFATVVSYDQRSTGLSDPVSLGDLPTLEGWTDDLHAVVTAAGLERVVLLAEALAGPVAALYAATRPERTRALILLNSFAAASRSGDRDAALRSEEHERFVESLERSWGSGRFLRGIMPDVPVDDAQLRDLARGERQSMSPAVAGAIFRWLYGTDVRAVLPAISAPTLVLHTVENRIVSVERGRYLAQHIPNARLVELPSADNAVFLGSAVGPAVVDEIEEFLTGTLAAHHTRMLTTLVFTDVVGSTDRLAAVGDQAWRTVLDRHDEAVRRQLARFSGHQEKLTGDGILATFDGPPARSVVGPRSATPPARSASMSAWGSTPVKSNDAAPSWRASPSTSHVVCAKPHGLVRCSCRGPSSMSWQVRVRLSTTAASTNSKAYPPRGDSSRSPPEATRVRRQTTKSSRASDTDRPDGCLSAWSCGCS
jgi:pimeloyl-ACP methyl ester carboxylesterase